MAFPDFPKEVGARILDNVVTICDGPRAAVAAGLHGVCRAWRAELLNHPKWCDECVREGVGLIDRPDGVPVDWGAHYLSYAASRETQAKIMEAVMLRKNIFMTGPGGTGKTVMISVMANQLTDLGMTVCISATTGMAATLIGGTTLHRWGGVGLAKEDAATLFKRMRRETRQRWRETDVLIIDEVSMLDPELFGKFDELARKIRGCHDKLFGGIQLILSGDFLQLPPVKPEGQFRFAFQHPEWEKGVHRTYVFKHVYRTTDALFTDVLGRVRTGDHNAEDVQILKTRMGARIGEAEDLGILPTRLYSHRMNVDDYNKSQLDALTGAPRASNAQISVKRRSGGGGHTSQLRYALGYTRAENQAFGQCPVGRSMEYKNGAQVMLVVNLNPNEDLVNGSRGVVTDAHDEDGVEVRFLNGETRVVEPFMWKYDDARGDKGEDITLTLKQIPLALAWAYTVHKAQGATLDAAVMDLGARVFGSGMSYVSLSRVRALKSLSLIALDASAIRADPLVKAYYAYIESNGTHKGFRATVNKIVFPTTHEMCSLVKILPKLKERREAAAAARKRAAEEASGDAAVGTEEEAGEPVHKRARTD